MKDLLNFRLPHFFRINWTDSNAQSDWAKTIQRAAQVWTSLEVLSLESSLRSVALLEANSMPPTSLPSSLKATTLEMVHGLPGPSFSEPVVIGNAQNTLAFKEAWSAKDSEAIGKMLGYPPCCIAHFQECYQDSRFWSPPWAWLGSERELQLDCRPETNILLHLLGLQLIPHIPCSPQCTASLELAKKYQQLKVPEELKVDLEKLQHILKWPVEWSALHGVAEIKTPVFRISTNTTATGQRYQIQHQGNSWPQKSKEGIRFPYRLSSIEDSLKSRQRGMENPIMALSPEEQRIQSKAWDQKGPQMPTIDWKRVAVPQPDGYDTSVILECAALKYPSSPKKSDSVQGSEWVWLDQTIAVCPPLPCSALGEEFENAPLGHPNLEEAIRLLKCWPQGYEQVKTMVHTLHPVVYRDLPEDQWGQLLGSCSHSFQHEFGIIHATIHDPIALAQALVHEMAHMKLFALGFWKECTDHLITNPLEETYPGTIRTDAPRPMSALLHAQYSFIHVIQLNLFILKNDKAAHHRENLAHLLERNVTRMEQSHQILADHATLDDNGKSFMAPFMEWSSEMIEQGKQALSCFPH